MGDTLRALVAYGSTRGGTAGLAHMVADAFTRHHIRTDVRRAGDVKDVSSYDAIVVGGALYNNRWHPEAVGFVGKHRSELRSLPVWFFSSGPLDDSARSGALAPVPQVIGLAKEVEIRGHMTFGGLMVQRHNRLAGLFAWGPEGDFRDRRHVSEWTAQIAAELGHQPEPMVRIIGGETYPTTPERPPIVSLDAPIELPPDVPDRLAGVARGRLRRYLTLDEEESDDDGLDLLLGVPEA
jgi:menaquinone-dependent protoporphyrinogen oxidase